MLTTITTVGKPLERITLALLWSIADIEQLPFVFPFFFDTEQLHRSFTKDRSQVSRNLCHSRTPRQGLWAARPTCLCLLCIATQNSNKFDLNTVPTRRGL